MNIQLQPEVLRWVRERARLTRQELADSLKVDQGRIDRWERTGEITFSLAGKMAHKTHVPFGFLYLPSPLQESLPIQDFRSVAGARQSYPSPELRDVLYEAQVRQDWYREYLLNEGAEPLDFVGGVRLTDNLENVAGKIRKRFGLETQIRLNATSWDHALKLHIEQVEEARADAPPSGFVDSIFLATV